MNAPLPDKNGHLIYPGMRVKMPEPSPEAGDLHNHSFIGEVFHVGANYIIVEDSWGRWPIESYRTEIQETLPAGEQNK